MKQPKAKPRAKTRSKKTPLTRLLNHPQAKPVGGAAALALFLTASIAGLSTARTHLRLSDAEAQLMRGFHALAAETLDPVRAGLTGNLRGCLALMSAFNGAHRADRLEWAAQACITAGVESPEVYIGLAAARELTGRDDEAVLLLNRVAERFPKSPEAYYRLAQIHRRAKKEAEAADALFKAAELVPNNNQISMEALQGLLGVGRWPEAQRMADRLRDVSTESAEVKLLIARAMLKGGDSEGATAQVRIAQAMIEKKPEIKVVLTQAFGEELALASPEGMRSPASPADKAATSAPAATESQPVTLAPPPLSPATPPSRF